MTTLHKSTLKAAEQLSEALELLDRELEFDDFSGGSALVELEEAAKEALQALRSVLREMEA